MRDENTVVLVGHCVPDNYMLRSFVQHNLPDAEVAIVNDHAHLDDYLRAGVVLLVNRVLDGRFSTGSGIELIKSIVGRGAAALLISNYAESQQQAVAIGAEPGFGKSELGAATTVDRLRAALAAATA